MSLFALQDDGIRIRSIVLFLISVCFARQVYSEDLEKQLLQQHTSFPIELVQFEAMPRHPVFKSGKRSAWDAAIRERGWIVRHEGVWHLFYTGYDGDRTSPKKLGHATSDDGITWKRDPQNPLFDQVWVEDVMVLRDTPQRRWLMFAEGKNDQAQWLTSTDLRVWKRQGSLDVRLVNGKPIPSGPYGTPTVLKRSDGLWHLFYERRDAGVWLATSKDLSVWTNVSDDPVLPLGKKSDWDGLMIAMNQVIEHQGRYYAYYHGTNTPTKPRAWACGVAVSDDLKNWTKWSGNPITPPSENKSSGQLVPLGNGRFAFYTMHGQVVRHMHDSREP